MQAVQLTDHGGRDVLSYDEVSDPEPAAGEVLLDVKAGALNHLDVWTRRGLPGLDLDLPHVPGSDAAGVVTEVGADVTRFEPGDHVAVWAGVSCGDCEFCRRGKPTLCVDYHVLGEHVPGVHAEQVAVHEDTLLPVPEDVDWATAAATPLVFGTAWRMLIERGDLAAGESVLVLGASGGVGHAAVQIAAHAGCEVFAAAGTAEKRAYAAEIGADHTIDYTEANFADEVRAETGKRGVDVVVDHVGADTWADSLRALARGGRVLTCGATTGGRPQTNIDRIFWNQLSVIGSTMASLGTAQRVCDLVWDGTFEVRIRERLPMSRTARGHELLEGREGFGKVVVVPDSEYDD
jgi:NADPH:quinone reductase-like Zn-dependent oxidoreductase